MSGLETIECGTGDWVEVHQDIHGMIALAIDERNDGHAKSFSIVRLSPDEAARIRDALGLAIEGRLPKIRELLEDKK